MLFSPKGLSFLLACCIALITTAFLGLVEGTSDQALLVGFGLAFSSSLILIYIALEFLVFREITKIYSILNKVKIKDFKLPRKRVFTDVNPLRRLNDEIFAYTTRKQQEIDELKKLEVFRREFLANVSHELKTPIFAAQGFIHTLIDGAVDDKSVRDKFLEKAARSLDGLDALVQDLLTLSQMETGDIKMQYEKFDLYEVTADIFEQLEEKAASKSIKLKFEKNQEKRIMAYADYQRIGQVMTNLIENAIKYGNEGGKVVVSVAPEKDHLVVSVKDDGPGIEPEHLKRIFERFYRIEKSRSKDKGGTGLGLAIVKHIIEAHKSKVSVTSKPGKGSQFSFKLEKAENH
jgi:two-component system phosphate regulon sensor histidine kinase PhoR